MIWAICIFWWNDRPLHRKGWPKRSIWIINSKVQYKCLFNCRQKAPNLIPNGLNRRQWFRIALKSAFLMSNPVYINFVYVWRQIEKSFRMKNRQPWIQRCQKICFGKEIWVSLDIFRAMWVSFLLLAYAILVVNRSKYRFSHLISTFSNRNYILWKFNNF